MAEIEVRRRIALRNVPGVELAAAGRWHASTGWTTFTQEDLVNAVAALDCPGVRNPVIKLGHQEEDSTSGVRWDGEPAVGWIGNMRLEGAKLVGDYMGMPEWLTEADENGNSVLASAYPDRSIEMWRPFVCQIGHNHPAVVTALSLLGAERPGVGVLKSMQDVYALFTEPPSGDDVISQLSASFSQIGSKRLSTTVRLAATREPTPVERRSGTDFGEVAAQWSGALADLLDAWPEEVTAPQADLLAAQVAETVADEPDALGSITATAAGTALLLAAMTTVAQAAIAEQVAAAQAQNVTVPPPEPDTAALEVLALAVTGTMAAATAAAAGRFAAQLLGSGTPAEIAAQVKTHLTGLGDRFLRDQLGGALSAAQAAGRLQVLQVAPTGRYYASELADADSCELCAAVDGTEFETLAEAEAAYGSGKFVGCLGGPRCRGQLVTVWDAAPVAASVRTTIRTSIGDAMPTAAVRASVSVEDISRSYYETAGYSMWITAMHVDPLELVASDDATGKFFRIPVELSGDQFTFGEPQEVAIVYEDVKAAASAIPHRWQDRKAALAAAGKAEDGTDLAAADVSPAGAALKRMAQGAPVTPPTVTTEIPDATKAAGSTTEEKEESTVATVDPAKLREALGLAADAPEKEVQEAVAAALTSAAPTPPATTDPASLLAAIPEGSGAIVLDADNYKTLLAKADQGVKAFEQVRRNERDQVLTAAAKEGRFPVAKLADYQAMWDKNPDATRDFIKLMPKNSVPTTLTAGFLGDSYDASESDLAYDAYAGSGQRNG